MKVQVSSVKSVYGASSQKQEYVRSSFDTELWSKMNVGDSLSVPAESELPEDLANYVSESFGKNTVLTKLSDATDIDGEQGVTLLSFGEL